MAALCGHFFVLPAPDLSVVTVKLRKKTMENQIFHQPARDNGFAGLCDYAAIGEGRSVALIAPDGSIDWWCAQNLDAKPLFDRLKARPPRC
ncbi:hypothetical protein FD733_03555 [Pantoea sp. Eser]|nr:hypothetical protein [Pantoea sp. Eser]